MLRLKKLFCIAFSIIIIALFYAIYTRPVLFDYSNKVTIYSKNCSFSNALYIVNRGEYFSTDKIYGESAVIEGYSASEIFDLFSAEILKTEVVDDITCYYGYTSVLPYEIDLFGEKVNVHVAVDGNKIILGTPLIFGSF